MKNIDKRKFGRTLGLMLQKENENLRLQKENEELKKTLSIIFALAKEKVFDN